MIAADKEILATASAEGSGEAGANGSVITTVEPDADGEGESNEQDSGAALIAEMEKDAVADIVPFEPDAEKWMLEESIPFAWPPMTYIGYANAQDIARELGRPLTLVEAKFLVQPDGEPAPCAHQKRHGRDVYHQPVKFLAKPMKNFRKKMDAEGKDFTQINHHFNGCFYIHDSALIYLSGPLFVFANGQYKFDRKSPLGAMARVLGRDFKRADLQLGRCREHALAKLQKQFEKRKKDRAERKVFDDSIYAIAHGIVGKKS